MINNDGNAPNISQQRKGRKKKLNLTVDTTPTATNAEHRSPTTPDGVRGKRDLRSPGMPKSPVAETALPDFITQTDANGNATTPRSAQAIEGAARASKIHPSSPSPTTRVGKKQEQDGNESDNSSSTGKDTMEEACHSFVDSFRMMCCCLTTHSGMEQDGSTTKKVQSSKTQDTDDNVDNAKGAADDHHRPKLLGSIHPSDTGKNCLVLDLDETLVHSSFRAVEGADFVIPVKIDEVVHFVYVMKRPGVDEFLLEMAKHYEIVIYTASLNKYADPLLDLLDPHRVIRYRLFRESCVFYEGNYVKDLSVLDRDVAKTIIIDNSPNSYLFHPENAIDCSSFIDDPNDRELDQIGSFLTGIRNAGDVRGIAPQWKDWPVINPIEEEEHL
mmetsp:Transcript_22449/g.47508  ORF Transcript_22449/g.47508 Transcript_22449/m.47508 type:complete len:386 (+) Transcript_22449:236-1393(+)